METDELIKKIDTKLGYMKPKPVEEYKSPVEKPIEGPLVAEVYSPTSEALRIAYRTGASGTKDAAVIDLLSSILYNGKAGLFDLNLNKQQKTQGASAGNLQLKDYGVFQLIASPKQGQTLEEVRDLLLEQISILKKGNFDESLLKATIANYKLGRLQALEDNTSRANNLADEFIKNRGLIYNKEVALLDEMSRITKKDVIDLANRTFSDKNYVVLYKRKGEDKNIIKVVKPPITPVETNEGKQSEFVKTILASPLTPLKPVFVDYQKDLQKSKLGKADVLYVQNKDNGLFNLYYRFDMGSWNNKMLPLATQYLSFLGTDKYSAEDISKQFYNLACTFSISADNEITTISISGLEENFDKAAGLFEHLINNCKPDAAALENLKNRLLRSRANSKTNKAAITSAMLNYAWYGAVNPIRYTLSDEEIKNLKAEDLTNLLHSLMNYEHKVLYYGPKTLPAAIASIQSIHKLPATWVPAPAAMKFERTRQADNQVLFTDYDAVQSEVYWIKNLDTYDPKEEAMVRLFNGYFGQGMGSVVMQTLRGSKALAYATEAGIITPAKKDDSYSAYAYVGSQADKMNEAVMGMNDLLNELPKTEQSFINTRKNLMQDIETGRITKENIIFNYLSSQRKGLDHDIRRDTYAAYANLTLNDLYKYHSTFLSKKPYTYAVIASEKRINVDDLKKYGEVKKLSLQELFGY